MDAALALCEGGAAEARASGEWRSAFLQAPYPRDTLVAMGVLCETFETAFTWDRLPALIEAVKEVAPAATCRLTHAYPDGAAPYFTIVAAAERGDEIAQWAAIKAAVSDAVLAAGGTI